MAIKNTKLGGTDWITNEKVTATDLNNTFTACTTFKDLNYTYSLPPVGSIIAYHINFSLSNNSIPSGWVDCNGGVISDVDSVYNGQNAPNLNGTTDDNSLFLMGDVTSGSTGGASAHTHSYSTYYADWHTNSYRSKYFPSASNIPKYFNIRWIMRIK